MLTVGVDETRHTASLSPRVSVIIPTTRRHDLVLRAVRSVIAQTVADIEIIVVIDGPNPDTVQALSTIDDPRLRIIQNEQPAGAGAARNTGAGQANGHFVAFLDDDDAWVPEKLARQIDAAGDDAVLVSCRTQVVTPLATYIWPETLYDGQTPIDEYLFDRKSLFRGGRWLQTSSYLLPRTLFQQTQFGTTRQHEDTTLLLRVTKQSGGRIVMVPDTLVVLYAEEDRDHLGSNYEWRDMLRWADSMGPLLTPRAYSGFCLIYLGSQAARLRDYAGLATLLSRALRRGAPTAMQLSGFFAFWIVPVGTRRRLRALLSRARRPALSSG